MGEAACPAGARVVDYFDHNSPEYVDHRHQWYQDIRREVGPVFWSPLYGGHWVVIGFEEINDALRDWETFSSKHVIDATGAACPVDGIKYEGLFVPPRPAAARMLEEDPPRWDTPREILAPSFSLPAAERWRGRIQELVDACIDRHIESGRIDFAKDLANIVPAIFSLELAGVGSDHYELVAHTTHLTSHLAGDDPAWKTVAANLEHQGQRIRQAIEAKRTGERGRDIISVLLNARDKGAAISDEDVFSLVNLVISAGIDTTSAVLGSTFQHLTRRPDLRQKLIDNPKLAVTAFEEFMRVSAPTQGLCRTVTRDVELGGQSLRRGDRVMLCFAAACRDPAEFYEAEDLVLERKPNLHVAFGGGLHRCLGSLYARLEFEVVFNTVLRRMPDFQVQLDQVQSYDNVGIVTGFISIPATFTAGPKVGADPRIAGWAVA
ncbi:MAG: bioI 2 [Phenylobacterium sp.]|nr:bioI 2 [Phenylobacterium sp.]